LYIAVGVAYVGVNLMLFLIYFIVILITQIENHSILIYDKKMVNEDSILIYDKKMVNEDGWTHDW